MSEKQSIGRYEIVSELGRGGMGAVFKAWEESLQGFVAIKMLGDQLTDDESLVARLRISITRTSSRCLRSTRMRGAPISQWST